MSTEIPDVIAMRLNNLKGQLDTIINEAPADDPGGWRAESAMAEVTIAINTIRRLYMWDSH